MVPKRIASTIDNPKVVIVLRNPIDRAYTQYLMLVARFGYVITIDSHSKVLVLNFIPREILTFEEIIQKEFLELETLRKSFRSCFSQPSCNLTSCIPEEPIHRHDASQTLIEIQSAKALLDYLRSSLLFRSLYDDMVERWISAVGKSNVLVLFHEDFYYTPRRCLNNILSFLGIDEIPANGRDFSKQTELETEWENISDETYDKLVDFFAPYNERLFSLIDRADTDWKYHKSTLKQNQNKN